jgi:hypothetical protein
MFRIAVSVSKLVRRTSTSSHNRFVSAGSSKDVDVTLPSSLKEHVEYRNAKINKIGEVVEIEDDDELQPQWKALEHRITRRVHKKDGRTGRSARHPSAWDAENV